MHPQNGGIAHTGSCGSVLSGAEMRRSLSASRNNGPIPPRRLPPSGSASNLAQQRRTLSGIALRQSGQPSSQSTAYSPRLLSQTERIQPTFQELQEDVSGTANNKKKMPPQPSGYSPVAPGNTSFLPPVAAVPPGYPATYDPAAVVHLQTGSMSGSYYGLPSVGSMSNYVPFNSQYSLTAGGLCSQPFAAGSAYTMNPSTSCYSIDSMADSTFNNLGGSMGSMYSLGGSMGTNNVLPTSVGSQYGEAFGLGGSLAGSMYGSFSSVANPSTAPLAGGEPVFADQHPNLSEEELLTSIMHETNAGEKMNLLNSVMKRMVDARLENGDAGATSFRNGSGTNAEAPSKGRDGNPTQSRTITVRADKLVTAFDRKAPVLNLAVVTNSVTITGGTNRFVALRNDAGPMCTCATAECLNLKNLSASRVLKLALKNVFFGRNISIVIVDSPIIALRELPRLFVRAVARHFTQDKAVTKWVLSCRAAVMPTPQRMRDLQDPDAEEKKAVFSVHSTVGTLIRCLKTNKAATEKDAVDQITALLAVPSAPNDATIVQYLVSCMRNKKSSTRSMTFFLTRDLSYLKAAKLGAKLSIPVLATAFASSCRTSIVIPITGDDNFIQWEAEAVSSSAILCLKKCRGPR